MVWHFPGITGTFKHSSMCLSRAFWICNAFCWYHAFQRLLQTNWHSQLTLLVTDWWYRCRVFFLSLLKCNKLYSPVFTAKECPFQGAQTSQKNVNHHLKIAFLSTKLPLVSSAVTFKSSSFWCFPQAEIFYVKGKLVWQEFWKIHCLPFTKGWSSNCRAEGRSCWSLHWEFEKSVHKMNMHSCNVITCKI